MIALFFEVLPKPGKEGAYFEMAAALKPALEASGGLLFLDRSQSTARPGWFLSHQIWNSEDDLGRWRSNAAHHRAQVCGRTDILQDYRLRVGPVIEVGPAVASSDAPPTRRISPAVPPAPAMEHARLLVSILTARALPKAGGEIFTSVYDPALVVQIVPANDPGHAAELLADAASGPACREARLCAISRDYGMFDRREAPQYFEPVTLG